MQIIVAHAKVCSESASRLAKAIGAKTWNVYRDAFPIFPYPKDLVVFNYGVSQIDRFNCTLINPPAAVRVSTDKIKSYAAFQKAGVPTCEFVTNEEDIPASWKTVVCRETTTGRNCEGVMICPRNDLVHGCPLYTKFFPNDEEHRIVVYKGKVLGRYMKTGLKDGFYDLQLMLPKGYEEIDDYAIRATAAVGLDYAGVDVLHNSKTGKSIVLEINSGPALTDAVEEFFSNLFNNR